MSAKPDFTKSPLSELFSDLVNVSESSFVLSDEYVRVELHVYHFYRVFYFTF